MPDYYPTLYPQAFDYAADAAGQLIFEPGYPVARQPVLSRVMAFPFVFPGAYSRPQTDWPTYAYGWIHSPDPEVPSRRQRRPV